MTPAPTMRRDASGKFAKKNPDCEPATKGYVKCLMRKMIKHDSYQYYYNECEDGGIVSGSGAVIFVFAWFAAMTAKTEPIAAWVTGVAAILCCIIMVESWQVPKIWATEKEHKVFDKYVEPQCEPKRGCEERE